MDVSIRDLQRVTRLIQSTGIKYEDLAYTTANGFAAMGTNNGHNGTTGVTFLGNPDILEDFAYRA
jgi:feruloyl esterase